ncbi:S1 RNA-binding domain-containing protein [Streptomyces clavifer]|uniref:S1 RNA-binding domain-containing protein n=1 Tax=Streptomyces TaxID=1883 RepID=UPI000B16D4B1|nr:MULTISPECIES: S1 RNA-binding domain-containing protein [unclassified Streptomyces]
MPDDRDVLPYVYRVTMYDPTDRDEYGHYTGPKDTVSDHGRVEDAYLRAVEAFAADAGIDRLTVREPQVPSLVHFGAERPEDGFGLDRVLPDGLTGFHDGAEVPLGVALELVRGMLRESGAWCRLEAEGAFAVHVGWDQYLYIGSGLPCEQSTARTHALGLFVERVHASPYDVETDEGAVQRPGDDDFWDGLRQAVATGRAGILEEMYVEGASRWHRLALDTLDAVRTGLAPRARLEVWPDLSSDVEAVLGALPREGLVECVWQDRKGWIQSIVADETDFTALVHRVTGADAAALLPMAADDRTPLFTAVMPDRDGVVRARWRTEPTTGDRRWAFLTSLHRGQIVSGPVVHIADYGIYVNIGGLDALINIPELSWRHISHPSDVVSTGQEISAEILDIDLSRERVSMSLRALHEDPMVRLTQQTGRTVVGRVTRIEPIGVFVRIEEREYGFEGLVHASEPAEGPSDQPLPVPQVGDALRVRILDVDPARRRITLSQRQAEA